jgi:hypothetical protein
MKKSGMKVETEGGYDVLLVLVLALVLVLMTTTA